VVHHAGWVASCLLAYLAVRLGAPEVAGAALLTAAEAVLSDLLGWAPAPKGGPEPKGWFYCGNFGILLLGAMGRDFALEVLQQMVRITMMRGAQCGGVVSYVKGKGSDAEDVKGVRSRVVNGKRTDLSELVVKKLASDQSKHSLLDESRMYAGHTRFATTSIASFDGCHPHQWTPARRLPVFDGFRSGGALTQSERNVEVYICHNGDLDFFDVAGKVYDLGGIQGWLERATGAPMPTTVDSCAVAGLVDLIRAQGVWVNAARFGFLFGVDRGSLDYDMPSQEAFAQAGKAMQNVFIKHVVGHKKAVDFSGNREKRASEDMGGLDEEESAKTNNSRQWLVDLIAKDVEGGPAALQLTVEDGLRGYVSTAVDAFFDNDLLYTTDFLMKGAKGSFGLCITTSLDSKRQIALAARGQTISIAFYPKTGVVLWGSEQAATKAAVGYPKAKSGKSANQVASEQYLPSSADPAMRLDLDDLGGEICLLDWGTDGIASASRAVQAKVAVHPMMGGRVTVSLIQESLSKFGLLRHRMIPLEDNPLVLPLPPIMSDPVGSDIADIPRICQQIQEAWQEGDKNDNLITAWNLSRTVKRRLRAKHAQVEPDPKAVDILVTGCEVSLWVGEQFVADLSMCLPGLNIKSISANKLLGLLGQDFPIPQTGHCFAEHSWDLTNTIVILVSHSGGTFGSLAVSNLLQAFTQDIFVVASEWDTQVGKQLRQMPIKMFETRIFSTDVGIRPAEPCSVSVIASHMLLTLLLEHIVHVVLGDVEFRTIAKPDIDLVALSELERCNVDSIKALEEITGYDVEGKKIPTKTETELRDKGRIWANHVLESPRSWIMIAFYIVLTVTLGYPPVTAICGDAIGLDTDSWIGYVTRFFDSLLYLFLPQWTILVIRAVQGRHLWHRQTGRAVVIGDVPWVAQSAEAFLSKLFACAYSNGSVAVMSGNPSDHLVHRHTHRVVRGALLAVGRPDGRLSALTTAENAVCLSVNQASSIQNYGVTCESLTIGHTDFKLPLTAHGIVLPGNRPRYMCEQVVAEQLKHDNSHLKSVSSGRLLGEYSNMRAEDHTAPTQIDDKLRVYMGVKNLDGAGETSPRPPAPALMRADSTFRMHRSSTINASQEEYFGEKRRGRKGRSVNSIIESQTISMRLYESRIASMERATAFYVMFHEMGKNVQDFWPRVSMGLLGYKMDRTHSIMRIATTASPVSGAEIRERMVYNALGREFKTAVHRIAKASRGWKLKRDIKEQAKALAQDSFKKE